MARSMRGIQTGNHVGNSVLGNGLELFLSGFGSKMQWPPLSPTFIPHLDMVFTSYRQNHRAFTSQNKKSKLLCLFCFHATRATVHS
jgi:hypothetical protein